MGIMAETEMRHEGDYEVFIPPGPIVRYPCILRSHPRAYLSIRRAHLGQERLEKHLPSGNPNLWPAQDQRHSG